MSVVSEPIGWLAGISSRKVDSGFTRHGLFSSVFMLFPVRLSEQERIGMIVLELGHDGQVFISDICSIWSLSKQ